MKKHFLLFDSGCSLCTSLARQVEEASDGKLIARSLRDPEIRSILDAENPGWSWEPMLLEMGDEGRQLYTGVGMRLHLARVLGPRRALEVAQIVQKATFFQPARRGILKLAGGLVAGLALGSWASKSVRAGDGLEAGATQKVFLPFLQSAFDKQAVEAEEAVRLVLGSSQFEELTRQNQPPSFKVDVVPKHLERVPMQDAQIYAAENQVAIFMGEEEGHRLYKVTLGTTRLSPDREDILFVGFVDTQQEEVLEVLKINVVPESTVETTMGRADEYQIMVQASSGRKIEFVTQNGQVNLEQMPVIGLNSLDNCSLVAGLLCSAVGQLACYMSCGAVCAFVTAGAGCVACAFVCEVTFITICTQAGNPCP